MSIAYCLDLNLCIIVSIVYPCLDHVCVDVSDVYNYAQVSMSMSVSMHKSFCLFIIFSIICLCLCHDCVYIYAQLSESMNVCLYVFI